MLLQDAIGFVSGTPQFRITESGLAAAPAYVLYSQSDLEEDLCGLVDEDNRDTLDEKRRRIKTADSVITAAAGDVVFSLLSGTAALVLPEHGGYLLTQNYVKLIPPETIDCRYLVYLINESREIRRQLRLGQQGSVTMKFTLKQLKTLELPALAPCERQGRIGELYLSVLRLNALKKRAAERETTMMLGIMREADRS